MKFNAMKAAVAVCLLVPVMAMAAKSETKTIQAKAEPVSINIDGIGSVTVGASWTDLTATYTDGKGSPFVASALTWSLSKGNTVFRTGTFDDAANLANTASIVFNEVGLNKGKYDLKFVGVWTLPAYKLDVKHDGVMTLGKPDYLKAVSPVPEPESYAMLLAGLGLMGTIALRRKKSDIS